MKSEGTSVMFCSEFVSASRARHSKPNIIRMNIKIKRIVSSVMTAEKILYNLNSKRVDRKWPSEIFALVPSEGDNSRSFCK